MTDVRVALACADELGEGPWWDVDRQVLWRVDIEGRKVHRWSPETGEQASWETPERVGCFVPGASGRGGIAALSSALAWIEFDAPKDHELMWLLDTYVPGEGIRFNDGKCDRYGRLWVGTMVEGDGVPRDSGALYSYQGEVPMRVDVTGVNISNGLGWSPDERAFYYTDSGAQTIWVYDLHSDGALGDRRVFAKDDDCFPDGLTVDSAGYVWSAKWNGSRVVRYAPDGRVDRTIELPVRRPTSVMFGGADLDVLYITSAWQGLRDRGELDGHLFECSPGVKGLPETPFDP